MVNMLRIISKAQSLLTGNARHAKLSAMEVDFRTATSLLQLNERIVAGDRDPARILEIFQGLRQHWSSQPLSKLIPFANDSMTIQLSEMFQHIHDVDSGDIATPATVPKLLPGDVHRSAAFQPSIGPSSHTNPLPTLRMQMKHVYEQSKAEASIHVREQLQQRLGFGLWLGPSQAATSYHQAGVYMRGRAVAGSVVALYPGAVYNSEMLQKAIDCGHLGNPNVQRALIPRFDESVIDTHASDAPKLNPYALAHHVRHPPAGVQPNVMRLQVDFMDLSAKTTGLMPFPPHLRDYIPNTFGSEISSGQAFAASLEQDVHCKGSVLIALRTLWDEEIFVDHTLNPYAKRANLIPAWAESDWEERKQLRQMTGRISREAVAASGSSSQVPRVAAS